MNDNLTRQSNASEILPKICDLLLRNGIKSTTMDKIASGLHVSKRTLYEMFQSKERMVEEALRYIHNHRRAAHQAAQSEAQNVMAGLMKGINLQRQWIVQTSASFFRDLDDFFPQAREKAREEKETFYRIFGAYLQKGIDEGYVRPDINIDVQCRVLALEMESLKRMEDCFPPHITLVDAFDCISLGFVRSIATPKGHEVIEAMRSNTHGEKQTKRTLTE